MAEDQRAGAASRQARGDENDVRDVRDVQVEVGGAEGAGKRSSLDPRGWSRGTAIFATIGAAATGYLAVYAYHRFSGGNSPGARGPAFSDSQQHAAKDFSSTRAAGPEAMRDPPESWDPQDEASDESFPASDPPAVGSRVD